MNKSLNNKSILITRDKKQSAGLIKKIEAAGGRAVVFPMIKITEPENWTTCDNQLRNISAFDWIVFSSANGVRFFFQRLEQLNLSSFSAKIAVIGVKTKAVLESFGKKADLIPPHFNAAGLLKSFGSFHLNGKKILIPTADIAGPELQAGLIKLGAITTRVTVYRTVCEEKKQDIDISTLIEKKHISAILFFSPSAVHCFIKRAGNQIIKKIITQKLAVAAIGLTTAKAVIKVGCPQPIVATESAEESLLKALIGYFENQTEAEK